jgi:hypothetical protein
LLCMDVTRCRRKTALVEALCKRLRHASDIFVITNDIYTKEARIHEFGSPEVIRIDDVPQPTPNEGQILVRVAAAGVGPWDALLRERKASKKIL